MDLEESFANLSVTSEIEASPRRKNPALHRFHSTSPHYEQNARVAVILAPDSYKHEFSRYWEPKSVSSTIVETPERLNSCAIGIGAAACKVPIKLLECTTGRDLRKSKAVIRVHGTDWIDSLYELCEKVSESHADKKVEVPESWPSGDMYLAAESIRALEAVVSSIEQGIELIFTGITPRVFCAVRPPGHHCHQDAASGFCLMNNAHIAVQQAKSYGVTHAAIFDFDLHHGDGTQDLCWKLGFQKEEIPIAYYSVHDIHSFPTEKDYADPELIMRASTCVEAHDMHIWNVHLAKWATPEDFEKLYEERYSRLFIQAQRFFEKHSGNDSRPLVIISAGFDGSEHEMKSMQRHEVSVPTSFFNRFTRDCVALANTFCEGRVISLLEGGYSSKALSTGVFSHLTGLASKEWDNEWIAGDIPELFEKGTKKTWKSPGGWHGTAIQMGRELFTLRPPSAPRRPPTVVTITSPSQRLRRKRINIKYEEDTD